MSESQTTGHPPVWTKAMKLLHECEKHFAESMVLGWAGVIEGSVEKLYSEAETSGDDGVQRRCHAAARQLSRNKERQRKRLRVGIAALFDDPPQKTDTQKPRRTDPPPDGLSEDEQQALETVINSAELLFSSDLRALNTRLSVLVSRRTFDNATNPLGPRAFCRLMADGIEELELTSHDRLIVYEQAIRPLLQAFTRAYQWMNDRLATAGVLPHIKRKPKPSDRRVKSEGPPDGPSSAAGEWPPPGLKNEMRAECAAAIDCVHRLMDRIHHRPAMPDGSPQVLSLQELDSILAGLQSQSRMETSQRVREQLFSALRAAGRPVNPIHMHTIDLMGMVQDHVEEEIEASSAVSGIFAQLQLPLIRVALRDSSFLNDHDHPARQLMNAVTDASTLWADDSSELEEMWALMKSAVSDVVVQYDGDSSVFPDLIFELTNHVQQIRQRVHSLEKRHIAARQGQERLTLARVTASQCISDLIEKYDSPTFSRTLLQKGWFDYLALCYLRGGEEDPDFVEAVSTARFMAIAGSGRASKQLAAKLLNKLPAHGHVLSKGLPETSFSDDIVRSVVLHFRRTLEWSKDHDPGDKRPDWLAEEFAPDTLATMPDNGLEQPEDAVELKAKSALAEERARLRNTAFGTWFRLREPNGDWKQYKLGWMGPLSGQCLMIRPLGQSQDMPLTELARQLISGTGKRLADQHLPAFDRALVLVWRRLKKIAGEPDGGA